MHTPNFVPKLLTVGASLYIATGFGVFLSVADNQMRKNGILPLPPTVAAMSFLISVITFVLFRDFMFRRPTVQLSRILRENIGVILPFGTLAFLSLLLSANPTSYWGDDKKWIFLQTYDFCIFLSAMLLPTVEFVRKYFRWFVFVALATILGSVWYEVENPGVFSSVPNRAAGFPGNSNWGALVTVMICTMTLGYNDHKWSRIADLFIFAITGVGMYFTLSRSGALNLALLAGFYSAIAVFAGRNRIKNFLTIMFSGLGLILFLVTIVPFLSHSSQLMGNSKAPNRLLSFLDGGQIEDDGSAADRLAAANDALDHINSAPILGHGTGFNRRLRQTPHNLYLKLWVDSGILGLATWITLLLTGLWLFTVRRYRPGQALMLATIVGCFFSHNILEERTFLLLFGMAATMSLYEPATKERELLTFNHRSMRTRQNGLQPLPPAPVL